MMSKTKDFDCVEMKRKASLRMHELLSKMTDEERREYWRKGNAELRALWIKLRLEAGLPVPEDAVSTDA